MKQDDGRWMTFDLDQDTSMNISVTGTVVLKQTTGGTMQEVHLSAEQVALMFELAGDVQGAIDSGNHDYAGWEGNA